MNFLPMLTIALAGLSVLACNSSDFSGDSKKARDKPAERAGVADMSVDTNSDSKLGKTSKDTTKVNNDNRTEIDSNAKKDGGVPNKGTLIDLIGGLLKTNNDHVVDQPNDNELIFGKDKVFHIGDNQMSGSSCLLQIGVFNLSGKTYYFEFEVVKDNTMVEVRAKRICGVDYGDTNFMRIVKGSEVLDEQNLPEGVSNAAFPRMSLNRGFYAVIVESKKGSTSPKATDQNDFDDFIVGDIRVTADGPIKPGTVGAR